MDTRHSVIDSPLGDEFLAGRRPYFDLEEPADVLAARLF
jgi:hypothetical protein